MFLCGLLKMLFSCWIICFCGGKKNNLPTLINHNLFISPNTPLLVQCWDTSSHWQLLTTFSLQREASSWRRNRRSRLSLPSFRCLTGLRSPHRRPGDPDEPNLYSLGNHSIKGLAVGRPAWSRSRDCVPLQAAALRTPTAYLATQQ